MQESSTERAKSHSPAEPEPKVQYRLDRAVRLLLRGLSPPHPRDTKARNFSAARRFRTLVSQRLVRTLAQGDGVPVPVGRIP
jgi:hypothetical protein